MDKIQAGDGRDHGRGGDLGDPSWRGRNSPRRRYRLVTDEIQPARKEQSTDEILVAEDSSSHPLHFNFVVLVDFKIVFYFFSSF